MKKLQFIALLFICPFLSMEAQDATQALRYSQYNTFGTARYASQGGATGALGGDFSSLIANPAGLGFYRSSEFSVTPAFYWVNSRSNFMGNSVEDSQLKFTVGSIGAVKAKTSKESSGIVGSAFALGYTTLANFNNRTTMTGINNNSSLLDDFTWHANENPNQLSPYYEQLAYDTYLMPYDSVAGQYWHDMALDGYGQEQYRVAQQWGYIGEYSLSGAFNFSNVLYFGATFGFHSLRFYEEIYHTEADLDDHVLDFDSFKFREYNNTRGWGYTGRFGMIFRPFHMLRIGATFHLPTYYRLTDEKYSVMDSYWDNGSGISDATASSPSGVYDYRLQTPFRIDANASLILFSIATVSAGYGYVDYTSSRLDAYDYKFVDENRQVQRDLQETHNVSAGAEVRLGQIYLRGGGRYLMSPFVDERNNAETWVYSGGFGFRTKKAVFDLSYTHSTRSEVYSMYSYQPGANEVSINDIMTSNFMFTMGFKF